ncbi:Nucleolar protein 16 [Dimargaris verticillata]|uniref:Nucleolar protein 16 n=1 Tax=Dimargaris verticillata TaxID=2761393 RepID=A0A9W8B200_9FUNG|nr:Nucleolar protein 16 [Dimargaris verticillata]
MVTVRARRKVKNPRIKVRKRVKQTQTQTHRPTNAVLNKHWDNKLSARKNYEKLGLVAQLNGHARNPEKTVETPELYHNPADPFNEACDIDFQDAVEAEANAPAPLTGGVAHWQESESEDAKASTDSANVSLLQQLGRSNLGLIERDADGNITKVTVADPNNTTDKDAWKRWEPTPTVAKTDVVRELEKQAAAVAPAQYIMTSSQVEYLERLISKYGENFEAMARDIKRNNLQRTPGQLRRLYAKYQQHLENSAQK